MQLNVRNSQLILNDLKMSKNIYKWVKPIRYFAESLFDDDTNYMNLGAGPN